MIETLLTALLYGACGTVGVILWLCGRRDALGLRPVGRVFDIVLADRAARVVIVTFWWWLGWHFLVGQTVG